MLNLFICDGCGSSLKFIFCGNYMSECIWWNQLLDWLHIRKWKPEMGQLWQCCNCGTYKKIDDDA